MFSSTYIVSLLVSISMDTQLYFLAKIVIFCIKYVYRETENNIFSTIPPQPNK